MFGTTKGDFMTFLLEDNYFNSKEEIMILIIALGAIEAIKNNIISIDEAEKIIFSPYSEKALSNSRCNTEIIKIIESACELEDIKSLIPAKFDQSIDEIKSMIIDVLSCYEKYDKEQFIRWSIPL